MEDQTTKVILQVLQSSPTFGVLLLAIVWFARRDLVRWIGSVGKYADDYLDLKRSAVEVDREGAVATRELGSAIVRSMDRFESIATTSLESMSTELKTFRREIAPLIRSVGRSPVKTKADDGDLLLVANDTSGLLRQAVSVSVESGRLIVATTVAEALEGIDGVELKGVLVDSSIGVEDIAELSAIWVGPIVLIASTTDEFVDDKLSVGATASILVGDLSKVTLSKALKGVDDVEIIDLSIGRAINGRA